MGSNPAVHGFAYIHVHYGCWSWFLSLWKAMIVVPQFMEGCAVVHVGLELKLPPPGVSFMTICV